MVDGAVANKRVSRSAQNCGACQREILLRSFATEAASAAARQYQGCTARHGITCKEIHRTGGFATRGAQSTAARRTCQAATIRPGPEWFVLDASRRYYILSLWI